MPLRSHRHSGGGLPATVAVKVALPPSRPLRATGGCAIVGAPGAAVTTRAATGLVAEPAAFVTVTV